MADGVIIYIVGEIQVECLRDPYHLGCLSQKH
jgi:hypothetical protein